MTMGVVLLISATLSFSVYGQTDDTNKEDREKAIAAVEAAVPKAWKDPTRPVYHFRPPAQWMNDICGAIYYKGYYHIFYQYNPFNGDRWGDGYTLWAHARSRDLVRWEDLPWALLPMTDRGERRCNSGCVTLDGHGRPMIFYTFVPARQNATRLGKREHWGAIPLDDDLIRWRRVKDEPLMATGMNGVPANINGGWSDPFVFRSDGRAFVTFKSCNGLVCEAQNKALTQWKYAGRIDGVDGECPNFFTLQGKWVLLRSTMPLTYIVGDFDPNTINFHITDPPGALDYGFGKNPPKDRVMTRGLYGTNVFTDEDGRRIMVGWVSGFKAGRGWNGCMSLPRILTLDKDRRLIQTPAPELRQLRGQRFHIENLSIANESKRLDGAHGDTLEIMAEFIPADAARLRSESSLQRGWTGRRYAQVRRRNSECGRDRGANGPGRWPQNSQAACLSRQIRNGSVYQRWAYVRHSRKLPRRKGPGRCCLFREWQCYSKVA